jgi:hypothetical protein
MNYDLKVIARSVPAILIVLGFIAAFGLNDGSGWFLIILGVVLQLLYLASRYR